jgi:hypothetical protein
LFSPRAATGFGFCSVDRRVAQGVKLETPNNNGNTPFSIACQHRRLDIAALLLEQGVNMQPVNKKGSTPFFFACQEGNLDVVKFLARNGVDMTHGKNGISPFHMACYRGHLDVVTYLVVEASHHRAIEPSSVPAPSSTRRHITTPRDKLPNQRRSRWSGRLNRRRRLSRAFAPAGGRARVGRTASRHRDSAAAEGDEPVRERRRNAARPRQTDGPRVPAPM